MLPCCQCSTASATVHPGPSFFRTPFHRVNIQIRHIFSNCPVGECGRDPPLWRSALGLVRAWLQMKPCPHRVQSYRFCSLANGHVTSFPGCSKRRIAGIAVCVSRPMQFACRIIAASWGLPESCLADMAGSKMTMGLFENGSDFRCFSWSGQWTRQCARCGPMSSLDCGPARCATRRPCHSLRIWCSTCLRTGTVREHAGSDRLASALEFLAESVDHTPSAMPRGVGLARQYFGIVQAAGTSIKSPRGLVEWDGTLWLG